MYYTKDGQSLTTESKTSMLWLGDAQNQASKSMRALYGEGLKSDMLKYAHHGFAGCEWKFYQLVAPKLIWWPQGHAEFKAYVTAGGAETSANGVNYRVINNLKSLQYIIVSLPGNYTLTIGSKGAVYTRWSSTNKLGVRKLVLDPSLSIIPALEPVNGSFTGGYLFTKYL